MYFEVNITPKQKEEPVERDPQTRLNLVLAPFQPQTRIHIEATLNTTAYFYLNLRNLGSRPLNVQVTKKPPPERAVVLSLSKWKIHPQQDEELLISWTARELGTSRDIIQLTDSRRIKYDIALTTTTITGKKHGAKNNVKESRAQTIDVVKKVLVENISPKKKCVPKRISHLSENIADNTVKNRSASSSVTKYQGKENITGLTDLHWQTPKKSSTTFFGQRQHITDISEGHQRNFSMLMESDTLALTPPPWFKNDSVHSENISSESSQFTTQSYTALLSSPNLERQELRRETYVTAPVCKNITFTNEDIKNQFEDSLSPRITNSNSEFSLLINGLNFASANTPTSQFKSEVQDSPDTHEPFIPHNATPTSSKNNTFEIESSWIKNECNNSENKDLFPVPETSAKLSETNRLLPTRLSRNFARLSPVMPVESNVAAYAASSSPICGNETGDISANNSRSGFYGLTSLSKQPNISGVKEVLEADLWAKPMNQYPFTVPKSGASLESIREESVKITPVIDKTYVKRFSDSKFSNVSATPDNRRFEISPPSRTHAKKISPIRKISPKKYAKVSKEKNTHEIQGLKKIAGMNTSLKRRGKVSIPGVQITKLSLAGVTRRKCNTESSKGFENEVSMKLHDPDSFLTRLCNPDPFAATTTEDPFLASTLYYDYNWVENQEVEFKKWLNALLTPPEHLTSNVDTPLIDVAKVWQSCRLKEDVSLAETKEAVSARYHTNQRLNTLRRAACTMLRSNEVVSVLSKVTVCVERGNLVIRQDRDLHKDIGLQKLVLELFLCYNPLWLRIALEAIYGETIPLNSNNDIIRLSKFLLTRFFSDPSIVKAHSHQTVLNLRLPSFFAVMNKFMLKKFLFVVYFLDYAKTHKLIGHDPCLFHKQAEHKESRRILLKFSQELLSGVGDITRVLKPYGYVLNHRQKELDEYNYAINNLSLDLRDGVRLCRVMELITGKRNLTVVCRVPAISRLQKVYNVDVALKALASSGYEVKGNITAKCIADGHREKTLSLLWQLIYKFQAPHFHRAATTIQKWWRSKLWWVRVRNFLKKRKNNAASIIQNAWRSYLARNELKRLRAEHLLIFKVKSDAARIIQSKWMATIRMWREKKYLQRLKSSAIIIQRSWRRYQATKPFVTMFKRNQIASRIIQRWWRATKLMRLQMSLYWIFKDAVIKIQSWWRAKLVQKAASNRYKTTKRAAQLIQTRWRSNRQMRVVRKEYLTKINAVGTIQDWWRRELTFKKNRNDFLLMKDAVRVLENWWLLHSAKRKLQAQFNKENNAAILIQHKWRTLRISRQQRMTFLRTREAACAIQSRWLAKKNARSVRQSYILKRNSAIVIQAYWRNWRVGFEQRCSFLSLKGAAICMQDRFRANKTTRQVSAEYAKLKYSTIIIQRKWRATRLMRQTQKDFLCKKKAAVIIQKQYRMIVAMRRYETKKRAIHKLQLWWKAWIAGKKTKLYYDQLKSSTIATQQKYRARRLGASVRQELAILKSNTIFIQQKWRANKSMQQQRNDFQAKKQAVINIQLWWKAYLITREIKSYYDLLKSTTIWVQHRYRARKAGSSVQQEFHNLKKHVIIVQRNWRAKKMMQTCRRNYLVKRQATVKIQSWWRAFSVAKKTKLHFDILKSATVALQRKFRARKLGASIRRKYESLKTNVIFIQRIWLAKKLMQSDRNKFLMQRWAVIKIQCWWRAIILGRTCQEHYEKQKNAAIKIQKWYRWMVDDRIKRKYYEIAFTSIIKIQRWWREILARRERIRQRRRSAATIIQSIWRGHKVRLMQSHEMAKLRERSEKAALEAQPSATLAHRLDVALNIVQEYDNLGKLMQGLTALDTVTHLLPHGCIALCNANLVSKLYDLLQRANRSRPWMDICLRASSILVSLVKYAPTKSYAWQEQYIETILHLLTATVDRETGVFINLATLMWLLADSPARIKAITESPSASRTFVSLSNLVTKKRSRLSSGPKLTSTSCMLPNPKPDWGLKHSRPRLFTSVHHAVGALCKRLKIG
ncbi:protein abnormal spindle [Athalia rosae]|uniref:protein abnormal spindle n=1 Tax=Athalia rosae TaxID=37344 RepID=UPI002033433D|nr:protein abnormal spindle [Athalia rosae]